MRIISQNIIVGIVQKHYFPTNKLWISSGLILKNTKVNTTYLHSLSLNNKVVYNFASKAQKTAQYFNDQSQSNIEGKQEQGPASLQKYIKNYQTIQILQKKGIKGLFPIQKLTYEAIYNGKDILASDRTGSGKTIAYSLPLLQKFRDNKIFKSGKKQVKFLIMCPTRQLTIQVHRQILSLKHNNNDFSIAAIYGGSSIQSQIQQIRNGIDIIVATPGRLMDLMERKVIRFNELQATCIDQADQMLQKGFKLDVQQIFKQIQAQRQEKTQNLMFSATIPEWVDKICRQYLSPDKKRVNLISKHQNQTSTTVQHLAVQYKSNDPTQRAKFIKDLIMAYNSSEDQGTIIFAQTKMQVNDIAQQLGRQASFLQGDMSQRQREINLNNFIKGKTKILVATDVASRGLDIDNVGMVIQLQPPRTEPFIHRAGRTGRAGRKGICITLFHRKAINEMIRIQNQAKISFKHITRPKNDISSSQWKQSLFQIPHKIKQIKSSQINNKQLDMIAESLLKSNQDVKQFIKKQLVLHLGQCPKSVSLTSQEKGYKTYLIQSKKPETSIDKLKTLQLLRNKFNSQFKITSVHPQSNNILFDIPQVVLSQFCQELQNFQIQNKDYNIRQAKSQDKQLQSLRNYTSSSRRYGNDDNRAFRSRNNQSEQMNKRAGSGDGRTLFIIGVSKDVSKQDIEDKLTQMGIQHQNVRLVPRSQQHCIGFLQVAKPQDYEYLIAKGLNINNQRIRIKQYIQNNQFKGNRQGGSNRSFNRNQRGSDRGNDRSFGKNSFNRGQNNGRFQRSNRNEDNNRQEYTDKRKQRNRFFQ